MRHWIFQANPDTFNVDTYINRQDAVLWQVNQSHFRDQMSQGDKVFIWRSKGKSSGYKTYGIIAEGTLSSSPSFLPDDANELWKNSNSEPIGLELRQIYITYWMTICCL